MSQETATWLGSIDDDLHRKLEKAGLVARRCTAKLGDFIDGFIVGRKDVKIGTVIRWKQDRKKLVDFFGNECRVDTITDRQAEEFKQHLFEQRLARGTISKHLSNCKMFFDEMQRAGVVRANPFENVRVVAVVDERRNEYVEQDLVYAAMDAAPDNEWRLIIALSRFGGLRCPSEVLSLEWDCINWEKEEILVFSPKTERHPNGMQRTTPLLPELIVPLRNVWLERSEGAKYVISHHRSHADNPEIMATRGWSACNLRNPFSDILKRAGINQWKKLFHGMRASCETDLCREYPIQDVVAWLGNSVNIAHKHYLRTRKIHFERAAMYGLNPPKTEPPTPMVTSDRDDLFRAALEAMKKAVDAR